MLRLYEENRDQAFKDYRAAREMFLPKKTEDEYREKVIYWDDGVRYFIQEAAKCEADPMDEPIKGEGFELIERV